MVVLILCRWIARRQRKSQKLQNIGVVFMLSLYIIWLGKNIANLRYRWTDWTVEARKPDGVRFVFFSLFTCCKLWVHYSKVTKFCSECWWLKTMYAVWIPLDEPWLDVISWEWNVRPTLVCGGIQKQCVRCLLLLSWLFAHEFSANWLYVLFECSQMKWRFLGWKNIRISF